MYTLANVTKVYSGKPGCMCGCRGRYSYTAHGAAEDSPGYDVSDSINECSVKLIFNKVMNNPKHKVEDGIAFVDTDTRSLVVYFKD
jgi:hypothetical protein